jgi:hypothetical protein
VTTTEKAASQEHFIDLCRMLGELTPHEADPTGEYYAFEKRVSKAVGGDGYADAWKRDSFAWAIRSATGIGVVPDARPRLLSRELARHRGSRRGRSEPPVAGSEHASAPARPGPPPAGGATAQIGMQISVTKSAGSCDCAGPTTYRLNIGPASARPSMAIASPSAIAAAPKPE